MSIALRTPQKLVFIVLALVTVLALSLVLLSTVAHIDVWRMLLSLGGHIVPSALYGNG